MKVWQMHVRGMLDFGKDALTSWKRVSGVAVSYSMMPAMMPAAVALMSVRDQSGAHGNAQVCRSQNAGGAID